MQDNHWRFSLFLLACLSGAAPVRAETLEQAMALAYTSNPTLLSERSKLRATDELVPQALSNWRPSVVVSGNATRSDIYSYVNSGSSVPITAAGTSGPTAVTTSASQLYNNQTMGVTVTEALYRGGRTTAQTRQAEAQVAAERAVLSVTEQQVLLNVAAAYLGLVQAQAVLQLGINNEQVLQRQLDATEDRFRVGEVTRTDVAQAQSRLSAAHADRTQDEGNLRTARATYLQTVGHAPDHIDFPDFLPGVPGTVEQAQALAVQQNPSIISAQYSYQAALEGIDLVAGELLPTVSLSGSATRVINYDGPSTLENVTQAMVTVSVPLYQQGQEYSRLRGQKQTAGQMQSAADEARRDVEQSITASWDALEAGRSRRAAYNDQIRSAQIALEGVQRESQVGSRTVLDVLNAEQELLSAQVNEVQARHDEIVAAYQLLNATGQLTAQYLVLPVDMYDPTQHYEEVHDKWVGFGDMPEESGHGK